MKDRTRNLCSVLVSLVMLSLAASVHGQTVRLMGEGEGASRQAALQAALRSAVEKGVGVIIGSETIARDGMLIRDQIVAKAEGYARDFAVLNEQQQADGVWKVRVAAEVGALSKLEQDMLGIAMLIENKQWPRVMVVPDEIVDDKPSGTWAASTVLEAFLLEKGLKVVDAAQIRENKRQDLQRAAQDPALAAELGRQCGAEVVLVGSIRAAFAESLEPYAGLGTQQYFTANLNLKLVQTADAGIVASTSAEARAGSSTKEAGAQLAMRRAAEKIASRLFLQAICTWGREVQQRTEYEVTVIGADDPTLESIRAALRNDSNVKGVTDATLLNGIGRFRIEFLGSLSDLKDTVRRQVKEPVQMESPTTSRLELRLTNPKVTPTPPQGAESPAVASGDATPSMSTRPAGSNAVQPKNQSESSNIAGGGVIGKLNDIQKIAGIVLAVAVAGAFLVLVAIIARKGKRRNHS